MAELRKSEQPGYAYKNQQQFKNTRFNVQVLTAVKMYIMSLVDWWVKVKQSHYRPGLAQRYP
jgi:hypothetical protein